jgi:hypothetical protein
MTTIVFGDEYGGMRRRMSMKKKNWDLQLILTSRGEGRNIRLGAMSQRVPKDGISFLHPSNLVRSVLGPEAFHQVRSRLNSP